MNRAAGIALLAGIACNGSTSDLVGRGFGNARLTGCFRFDQPYFTGDSVLVFFSERSRSHFLQDSLRYVVRPMTVKLDSTQWTQRQEFSDWRPEGDDKVVVAWRDGFSGPVFRLSIRGDTLRGHVRQTTDVDYLLPRPELWWKRATAVRTQCA
jgi:hypothetical protein